MDEARKGEEPSTEQPVHLGRRPWRAPQFFVAEFANTRAVGNGTGDGHAGAESSS